MTEADETATDETGNRTAPHPTRRTLLTPQPPHGSSFRLCVGFTTLTSPRSIAPARALALVRSGERTRASGGRRRPGPDGGLSALAVTLWEGAYVHPINVQCRVMLRFLWTYLEELSNFDYDTTKKGAKG